MDIYREAILDYYKHPRNFGHLDKPDVRMEEGNVTCGDRVVMEFKVYKVRKVYKVEDVRFSGEGCAISQASASMLTEKVKGMTLDAAMKLTADDIISMIGSPLTPSRVRCATLSLEVLQKAVAFLQTHK